MNIDEHSLIPLEDGNSAASGGKPLEEMTFLTFRLAGQTYGIPVECVDQIIEMVTITQLPHAPAAVQGMINVHGRIVPVLDLRCRFNLPFRPYGLYTPIILVHTEDRPVGLIVDDVYDVHPVPISDLVKPDYFHLADLITLLDDDTDLAEAVERPPLPTAFLWAVAKTTDSIILVLNVTAILTHQEKSSLSWALAENETVSSDSQ
jgi:chemotaxis signal transduction protein